MTNYWTSEEDEKLISLLEKHEGKYSAISKYFPNRTTWALLRRFAKIDPSVKSGQWSSDEDATLLLWIFNTASDTISNSLSLFEGRKLTNVKNRIEYFKNELKDKLHLSIKTKNESVIKKSNTNKRKSKMAMKQEAKQQKMPPHDNIGNTFSEEDTKSCILKKTHNLIKRVKTEVGPVGASDWSTSAPLLKPTSPSMQSFNIGQSLQKFLRTQDHIPPALCNLTTREYHEIFDLQKALGNNWEAIAKFIPNTNSTSLKTHFYNFLRWTAYECQLAGSSAGHPLHKMCSGGEQLVHDFTNSTETQLMSVIQQARYLLTAYHTLSDEENNSFLWKSLDADENGELEASSETTSDLDAIVNMKVARIKQDVWKSFSKLTG